MIDDAEEEYSLTESQNTVKSTSLSLKDRAVLTLEGVEDVISFDEMSVYLITGNGNLLIEGTGLHITTLDVSNGSMKIEGFVRAMLYNDKEAGKKGGLFSKVVK